MFQSDEVLRNSTVYHTSLRVLIYEFEWNKVHFVANEIAFIWLKIKLYGCTCQLVRQNKNIRKMKSFILFPLFRYQIL